MTVVLEARRVFHQHLGEVRRDILCLAAAVSDAIPRCTEALLDGDVATAQIIIDGDDVLDDLANDIEDRCYLELALQQPMASDLRSLVGAMRLASELERSGDLVVNVAKAACRIARPPADARVRGLLQRMSDEAHTLFNFAVEAYAAGDADAAAQLDRMDDGLDAIHRHYTVRVLDSCREGVTEIPVAVQLALVGRFYERIGDHAVNAGQRVAFMVTGRHPLRDRRLVMDAVPLRASEGP